MESEFRIISLPPSKTAAKANDYLYHHGILGQKHGKRNSGHYPLNSGDFSPEELAAGAKESAWAQKGDEGQPKPKVVKSKLSKEEKQKYTGNPNQNVINKSKRMEEAKKEATKASTNDARENSNNSEKEVIKNKDYYKRTKSGSLSDEELRSAITRIQAEDNYNKLTNQVEKPPQDSFAKQMVKKMARQSIESIVESTSRKIGPAIVDKIMNNPEKKAKLEAEKRAREAAKDRSMVKKLLKRKSKYGEDRDAFYNSLSNKELEFLENRQKKRNDALRSIGYDPKYNSDDDYYNDLKIEYMNTRSRSRQKELAREFTRAGRENDLKNYLNTMNNIGMQPNIKSKYTASKGNKSNKNNNNNKNKNKRDWQWYKDKASSPTINSNNITTSYNNDDLRRILKDLKK